MSTTPTAYRPSPLSFNSPRNSPFRRPDSSAGRSPSTVRAGTPVGNTTVPRPTTPNASPSPEKQSTPHRDGPEAPKSGFVNRNGDSSWIASRNTRHDEGPSSPTKPGRSYTGSGSGDMLGSRKGSNETEAVVENKPAQRPLPSSPRETRTAPAPKPSTRPHVGRAISHGDPLNHLPPALLRSMRESFSVLDRNNNGGITRDDLVEALSQVGLDTSNTSLAEYFSHLGTSPGTKINLSTYLNSLAGPLADMTAAEELTNAFAAFDADDSGQIDLSELRDALLHTAPDPGERRLTETEVEGILREFGGRRAFGKGTSGGLNRGEVFRYLEFVAAMNGGGGKDGETV